jgi:hypothetical protein
MPSAGDSDDPKAVWQEVTFRVRPVKESDEKELLENREDDVGSTTNNEGNPVPKCDDDYVVVLQKETTEVPPNNIAPNVPTSFLDKKSFALGFGTGGALTAAIILLF